MLEMTLMFCGSYISHSPRGPSHAANFSTTRRLQVADEELRNIHVGWEDVINSVREDLLAGAQRLDPTIDLITFNSLAVVKWDPIEVFH